jgi:hypothetical protein
VTVSVKPPDLQHQLQQQRKQDRAVNIYVDLVAPSFRNNQTLTDAPLRLRHVEQSGSGMRPNRAVLESCHLAGFNRGNRPVTHQLGFEDPVRRIERLLD